MKATHISVCTREGTALFRRAGFVFTRSPTELAIADLTAEQLAAIQDERALEVTETQVSDERYVPPPPPEATDEEPRKRGKR